MKFSRLGVNREDVDALVQVIMKDPSLNIVMLPDPIEAQLYKGTILLTRNVIYSLLGLLDGVYILSHKLKLSIERDHDPTIRPQPKSEQPQPLLDFMQPILEGTMQAVNDNMFLQVAQR